MYILIILWNSRFLVQFLYRLMTCKLYLFQFYIICIILLKENRNLFFVNVESTKLYVFTYNTFHWIFSFSVTIFFYNAMKIKILQFFLVVCILIHVKIFALRNLFNIVTKFNNHINDNVCSCIEIRKMKNCIYYFRYVRVA